LTDLRRQEVAVERRLAEIQSTLERLIDVVGGKRRPARKAARRSAKAGSRRLSTAGREAISRAAKRRWAKYRRTQRQA
jgi:hypothetical protein